MLRRIAAHRESRHAVKYGIVGVCNVVIDLAVYTLLVHFGLWYLAARTIAVVVATVNGYTWNRIWTFRAGGHEHEKLVRYVTVTGVGLLLNLSMLTVLVEVFGVGAVRAAVIAIPFVAGFQFLANRFWTFGRHMPQDAAEPPLARAA
jgi:putative flippase GtrA